MGMQRAPYKPASAGDTGFLLQLVITNYSSPPHALLQADPERKVPVGGSQPCVVMVGSTTISAEALHWRSVRSLQLLSRV